jgi:hypothetical protein
MTFLRVRLAAALVAAAAAAAADSDGYYCATPAYLAYELRGFTSGPDGRLSPGHHLVLVAVDPEGVREPATIALPDFQVHGMRCGDKRVELSGWDSVHVVELGERLAMTLGPVTPHAPGGDRPGFTQDNLASGSTAVRTGEALVRVDLPLKGGAATYGLEIRHTSKECRHHVEAYLTRRDGTSEPRRLAAADFSRDCH